jgi:RNA polymerase sigma-70 factor (ECF subfamily)
MPVIPEDVLTRARAGDPAAVGALIEPARGYLMLLARIQSGRHLRAKLDPQDVVQDVLLEAHRQFARFRGSTEGELLGWLRQILAGVLANLVRRYLGTKARDVRLERELAADLDHSASRLDGGLTAGGTSPSQGAAGREQAVLLADALARLPDDYREVLVLRHLEELPFPDVAGRMGRSVEAVKKLWARAAARLRKELDASHVE